MHYSSNRVILKALFIHLHTLLRKFLWWWWCWLQSFYIHGYEFDSCFVVVIECLWVDLFHVELFECGKLVEDGSGVCLWLMIWVLLFIVIVLFIIFYLMLILFILVQIHTNLFNQPQCFLCRLKGSLIVLILWVYCTIL